MKLHEVKLLPDGKIYLKGGYYLEPDPLPTDGITRIDAQIWGLKGLMGDEELGEAGILCNSSDDVAIFKLKMYNANDNSWSTRYRGISKRQQLEAFYDWVESKLSLISEDIVSDLRKARQKRAQDSSPVRLVRLNKDESEARPRAATKYFQDEDEAIAHHNYMVKVNPSHTIRHNLHSKGDLGDFTLKLIGHKNLKESQECPFPEFIQLSDTDGYYLELMPDRWEFNKDEISSYVYYEVKQLMDDEPLGQAAMMQVKSPVAEPGEPWRAQWRLYKGKSFLTARDGLVHEPRIQDSFNVLKFKYWVAQHLEAAGII